MDKRRKIAVNSSSLVGLKAELLRKQEEFKKEKLGRASSSIKPSLSSKPGSIWSKKKKQAKGHVKKDVEELQKERDELDKSRSMLEAKAKLYEQMTSGNSIPDEETNGLFLVDFEKKQLDKVMKSDSWGNKIGHQVCSDEEEDILTPESEIPAPENPEEEWVDYTDTLGRSRRCMKKDLPRLIKLDKDLNPEKFKEESVGDARTDEGDMPEMMSSDMYRERMRKKWEQEQEDLLNRGQSSIHYQNVRFDEVRTHGVGYFDFAKDEDTRDEQLKTLNYLRDETVDKRSKREELKAKRKAALEARLEKVRQRKKIKMGDAGLVEEREDKKQEQTVEKKEEEPREEKMDPNWQRTLRLVEAAKKESSKEDRDWDVHKAPKAWVEQRAKIRDERPTEFAPPTDYIPSYAKKKTGKFNKTWRGQDPSSVKGQDYVGQRSYMNYNDSTVSNDQSEDSSGMSGRSQTLHAVGNQFEVRDSYGQMSARNSNVNTEVHLGGQRLRNSTNTEVESSKDASGNHSASAIPDSKTADERIIGESDAGRRSEQDVTDTDEPASQPAPLVRKQDSKPIKFSIGFGSKKQDKALPSTKNVLDSNEEEIKKTISFFRNQAS
ncbi:coiled-coil domain-containing protein 174-like [Apostichopus japonicus]|uniref:coiled-coil domain-containing protein 174-like n=1 Tax=Stichopus japonicus TaxID=307972 RepID=UPI003AB5589C